MFNLISNIIMTILEFIYGVFVSICNLVFAIVKINVIGACFIFTLALAYHIAKVNGLLL